jgi:WD40 repeat protein/tetratricopeptide (TPR) repeat protein
VPPAPAHNEVRTIPPQVEPAAEAASDAVPSAIQEPAERVGTSAEGAGWPSVPGYEILDEVARGGMGVVYRARQTGLNRVVALKMILAGGHAGDPERIRFRAEAEAVARLQHPNIVQVYEVGEHQGLPYFSLEFCPGGSLEQRLAGTPLAAREAAGLVAALARAVHAAHTAGVIHRDLKPANVLLGADSTPKVTDFGLAKRLDGAAGQTAAGAIVGTPSYMAPEQAGGRGNLVGPAADVYGLGAVLYECLTGRPPFRAVTPLDTVLQVLSQEPVPPSRFQPKLPCDLETICLKCLQKEPRKRYSTAHELSADLERFLDGQPVRARPVTGPERAWKWARRRLAVAALAAVLVLATFGLLGGALWYTAQAEKHAQNEKGFREIADEKRGEADRQTRAAVAARRDADIQKGVAQQRAKDLREALTKTEKAEQQIREDAGRLAILGGQAADGAFESARPDEAKRFLNMIPAEFRGWEWHYRQRHFQGSYLTLYPDAGPVSSVAFSPDGLRLASGSLLNNDTVKLWDTRSGQHVLTLHAGMVSSVAFSPDGQLLASASRGNPVLLWDTRSGQMVRALRGHTEEVMRVAFSPDGQQLASPSQDKSVKLWNTRTGQEVLTLRGHTDQVWSVAFSPDGQRLASASIDNTVRLWDSRTGREVLTLRGQPVISSVAFSPDGLRLAAGTWDNTVKLWDTRRGQEVLTLRGHTGGGVTSVTFSPDGQRLASGGGDNTVKLWDARSGQELLTLRGHTGGVSSVAFSPDGQRLASGGEDNTVKFWDARSDQEGLTLRGHTGTVWSVAFSRDGQRLATAGADGTVRLWDAGTGQVVLILHGDTDSVQSVALSADGLRLASDAANNTVKLWDARSGQELLTFRGHNGPVLSVAFRPDGLRLASGSLDKTVKLWDTRSGQEVLTLRGHTEAVMSVAFSPDGHRLASSGGDNTVKLWDARSGQEVGTVRRDTDPFTRVAFSPDSQWLAGGSGPGSTGTVVLWDTRSGQELLTLRGHKGQVMSVAFSPDGRRLASGSVDNAVKLWDTHSGQEVLNLRHTGWVRSVVFSPDGQRLASGAADGTVKLWDTRSGPRGFDLRAPDAAELAFREAMARFDTFWQKEQAEKQEVAGNWFAAAFHAEQLVRDNPDNAEAWEKLEVASTHLADCQKALARCDWQLAEEPTLAPLYFRRARLRAQRFAFDGATADHLAGLALAAGNRMGWLAHAVAADAAGHRYAERKDYAGACRAFTDAARWERADVGHLFWLARAQQAAGQPEAYRVTCRHLIEQFGTARDVAVVFRLSSELGFGLNAGLPFCRASGRPAATAVLQSVQESRIESIVGAACLVPDHGLRPEYLVRLATNYVRTNRSADSLSALGAAQYRAGLYAQAIATLENATRLYGDANLVWVQLFLAIAYERQNQPTKARACFAKARLEANPIWYSQLIYDRLHREAAELLKIAPQAPR